MCDLLSNAITAFDDAIAGDVLELFPGGLESLPGRTDEEIQEVVNNFGDGRDNSSNYQKARLCLYGTTALVALVDPAHENLWVANLGDCEAGTRRVAPTETVLLTKDPTRKSPHHIGRRWAPLSTRGAECATQRHQSS